MRFVITINADNAAFDGDACGQETARILRVLASLLETYDRLSMPRTDVALRDSNGNRVGECRIEEAK